MTRVLFACFLFVPIAAGAAPAISVWGNARTDQQRCEAEARYMALHAFRGHVGPSIGGFEGVGWGSNPHIATCVPRRTMRLTGDASVRAGNGVWYRVRSWR